MARTSKSRRNCRPKTTRRRRPRFEQLEDRRLLAVLLADSFEQGEWNGTWVEDGQNDWARRSQRASDGSYSAEVDGWANDATLTLASPLDLTSYESAELTFSWYIESNWDGGEYLAVDGYSGNNWTQLASLQGNVDAENTWHHEAITIDGSYLTSDFKIRFRAKVSSSREDGFVDNVRIEAAEQVGAQLSIDDVQRVEGDSGNSNLVFTVTRSGDTSGTSSVDFATANGTAGSTSDYIVTSGTLQFLANETTKTISVQVNGDTDVEADETFFVNLSNASGAAILDNQGTGTIVDDNDGALPGLVSHWNAENHSMDVAGDNDGTLVSTTYAAGQIGQAFSFDGVDDRIQIADSPSLQLTESMTIEGWVRVDSFTSGDGVVVFRGDDRGGLDPYQLRTRFDGTIQFQIQDASNNGASVVAPMPQGEFVYVAATLDDATGEMSLYLNGVRMAQTVTTVRPFGALDSNSNPGVGIGNHGGYPTTPHNFPFHGVIDELKIHEVALSDANILANFNSGKGSLQPKLIVEDTLAIEGDVQWAFADALALSTVPGSGQPWGVARGPSGDIYVAFNELVGGVAGRGKIEKIDGITGVVDENFVPFGTSGLNKAREFAFQGGWIYVTSRGTEEVLRFNESTGAPDPAGAFIAANAGGLTTPRGIVFDAAGDLIVSSKGTDQLLKFSGADGTFLSVFAANVTGGGTGPKDIALDAAGDLYVLGDDKVHKFNGANGASLGQFVSGGLLNTASLEFDANGDLFVADSNAKTVLQFDGLTGDLIETIDLDASNTGITGLAFDNAGRLNVASTASISEVRRYESVGSAISTVRLSSPNPGTVTVNYATSDSSAAAGSDYQATSGTLTFAPGVTTQIIQIPITDDAVAESSESFFVNLSSAAGAVIQDGQGEATIVDNDAPVDPTKFYVVDDSIDDMFEYQADGTLVTSYNLGTGNNSPRGAAATAAGDTVWVIDNDDHVYVHDNDGNLLREWKANGLSRPEGIATDGTDVWIVDRGNDRVHFFAGGATRTTDTSATSSFSLTAGNPRGITTDGTYLWVVDASTDDVYKYTVGGILLGSWAMDSRNTTPMGITINPGDVNDIWVIDSTDDAIYEYSGAASRTSGSQAAGAVFNLAAGNTNPQGIADPPPAFGPAVDLPIGQTPLPKTMIPAASDARQTVSFDTVSFDTTTGVPQLRLNRAEVERALEVYSASAIQRSLAPAPIGSLDEIAVAVDSMQKMDDSLKSLDEFFAESGDDLLAEDFLDSLF